MRLRLQGQWALFVLLAVASAVAPAGGLAVRTLDGQSSSLAGLLTPAKWNLVMVWTTHCTVCRAQYPTISAFHSEHRQHDAVVLGIALDGLTTTAQVSTYRKARGHTFPSVLADPDEFAYGFARATGESFTGTPTYLLFDRAGVLVNYVAGPVTAATLERAIAP